MIVKEIDAAELNRRLVAGEVIDLIDIRSDGEVALGVLPNAQHLPMHLLPLRLQDLPQEREFVLYCRSGARSYHACAYLAQQGIDNAVNLRGGIIAWAQEGLEISHLQTRGDRRSGHM